MATFAYTVRDASGQTRSGTSEAENSEILRRRISMFSASDVPVLVCPLESRTV